MNGYDKKKVEKLNEVSNNDLFNILRLVLDIYPENFIQREIKKGAEEKTRILTKIKEMKKYQVMFEVPQPYIHFMMRNHLITLPNTEDFMYESALSIEVDNIARKYFNFFRQTIFKMKKNIQYRFPFKLGKKELSNMLSLMESDLKKSWFYDNLIQCISLQVRDFKEEVECKRNAIFDEDEFYNESCNTGKIYHLLQTILDIYWMQDMLAKKEELIGRYNLTDDELWENVVLLFQYLYDFTSKKYDKSYIRYKIWHEFLLSLEKVIYMKEYGYRIYDDTITDRLIPSQTIVGYYWMSEAANKGDNDLQDLLNRMFSAENVMV